MSGYLIYHPRRLISRFGPRTVYHDSMGGNQDPYVWNRSFLHTYCHITQMSPQVGDINFWVSGDTFPAFSTLSCDLVFVVAHKVYWPHANDIQRDDPVVDSDNAYMDHYRWAMWQHRLARRRRYTLKADPATSFQPQDADGRLLDLVPMLEELGLTLDQLQRGLKAGFNSKPMRLGDQAAALYVMVAEAARVRLYGEELEALRAEALRGSGQQAMELTQRPSALFNERPTQWGLRGDPYLWDEMKAVLEDRAYPETEEELAVLLEETYERLTGAPLSRREPVYVERLSHGGMSSGHVDPRFWAGTALPLLLTRYRATKA